MTSVERRLTLWVDARRVLLGLGPRHIEAVADALVEHFGQVLAQERIDTIVGDVLARSARA